MLFCKSWCFVVVEFQSFELCIDHPTATGMDDVITTVPFSLWISASLPRSCCVIHSAVCFAVHWPWGDDCLGERPAARADHPLSPHLPLLPQG
jgi:hypothetical protein